MAAFIREEQTQLWYELSDSIRQANAPGEEPMSTATETTHQCPALGSGVTQCCERTPFEVPRTDRMTLDPALVTCGAADHEDQQ